MRVLSTGHLAGTADRLDTFLGDLTLDQLRGTATMGLVLAHPILRRDYEQSFADMLPVIGDMVQGWTTLRRAGVSSLEVGVGYVNILSSLNRGAQLMRPHFPRRDTLSDGDIIVLFGLQSMPEAMLV
jgi:hypothetical protein